MSETMSTDTFMQLCDELSELLITHGCADGTFMDASKRTLQIDCYSGQVRNLLELLSAGLTGRPW